MAHFQYTHYYSKKHVCSVCYAMYHKLDILRNEARNTANYFVLHPEKIKEEIRNYENEIGRAFEAQEMEERMIFSPEFYKKLEEY